jgi:hypothetical protein
MLRCDNCGSEVSEWAARCSHCRRSIEHVDVEAPPVARPPTAPKAYVAALLALGVAALAAAIGIRAYHGRPAGPPRGGPSVRAPAALTPPRTSSPTDGSS